MSLDCYPFGRRRTISLTEQPMAMDVAYNDDLFVSIVDQCHSLVIYDLSAPDSEKLVGKISLGQDIVVDQIIYCRTGEYLACVGHRNGKLSVYTIFQWREADKDALVSELSINLDDNNKRESLNSIDCCQKTGNLAVSCGDNILIYKYIDTDDGDCTEGQARNNKEHFEHIIGIKLSLWAQQIRLLENYVSITSLDHVQVLKLELLTVQIESDDVDSELFVNYDDQASSSDTIKYSRDQSETTSVTDTTIATTSCSMISDSSTTNFSSFNNNNSEQINTSDTTIITMKQPYDFYSEFYGNSNQSADDCITWNLNTKKLVKLPTLMHSTSTNLSSFHVCHPLELLGPASESIACRVSASIYAADYCQNQLEAVVMLCKQFDFDSDPVKTTHLQAVYRSSREDQERLSEVSKGSHPRETTLLKSGSYDRLASVTCFATTLTNCIVYSLHGKKVVRSQTITHPDFCLDFRPDLLNVYVLTPLGLQICSSGICDSVYRYDWSSSADLNLSFLALDRTRILTTSNYVILVGSSVNDHCQIDYLEKPSLATLFDRIVHTASRCNSISIRSNMLTYLHAMAQLELLCLANSQLSTDESETLQILKTVTVMLCKQLAQKKGTNVITDGRIDRTIKHLLDISMCDKSCWPPRSVELNADERDDQDSGDEQLQTSFRLQSPQMSPRFADLGKLDSPSGELNKYTNYRWSWQ